MKSSAAITAIVDRLKDPGVANLHADGFEGRQERDDIAARSRTLSLWAHVVILGSTAAGNPGAKVPRDVQFAAFLSLPFRPHPNARPWELMADLVDAVIGRLHAIDDWPDDMGSPAPATVRHQNLYQLADTKNAIVRALVQWTQRVDIDLLVDPPTLPDLETIVHDQAHIVDGAEDLAPTITTEITFP